MPRSARPAFAPSHRLTPGAPLACLAALFGCSPAPARPAAARAPIVSTAAPVATAPVAGAIPSLGTSGTFADAALTSTGPDFTHEATFSNRSDLAAAPGTSAPAWRASATAGATAAAPALGPRLDDALAQGGLELGKLTASYLQDAAQSLAGIPGVTIKDASTPTPHFLGYPPARARWLKGRYALPPKGPYDAEVLYSYDDPNVFQEVREHGARLYCAAREAMFQQAAAGTVSMGEQVGFSVTVLGRKIDFGVVEPTLVIDGPQRYLGPSCMSPNDGAQSFHVPLLFGAKITPVRGLGLRGLPEMRYPVVLTSADTEVTTWAAKRDIASGTGLVCDPFCHPDTVYTTDYSKQYQTVAHADALQSAEGAVGARFSTPLFFLGPVRVDLGVDFDLGLGQLTVANDRLLGPNPIVPPARGGSYTGYYHDGLWRLDLPSSGSYPYSVLSSDSTDPVLNGVLGAANPFLAKALADDDHAIAGGTSVGLAGSLAGVLGGSFGPFQVQLSVVGKIGSTLGLEDGLRDGALAFSPNGQLALQMEGVTVTPRTRASATLSGYAQLDLSLDLGFLGSISYHKVILDFGSTTLASYDQPWPEKNRFRLGYGSPYGNAMKKPASVLSHRARGASFDSFPVDVDACLTDPRANPPVPPECPPSTDNPTNPPRTNVCIYSGMQGLPDGVCGDITGYVSTFYGSASPDQAQCMGDLFAFLCQPVSQEQPWLAQTVVSRIFDLSDTPEMKALGDLVTECVTAWAPPDPSVWFASTFGFGVCDDTARLLTPPEVIGGSGPGAPPITDGTCP